MVERPVVLIGTAGENRLLQSRVIVGTGAPRPAPKSKGVAGGPFIVGQVRQKRRNARIRGQRDVGPGAPPG